MLKNVSPEYDYILDKDEYYKHHYINVRCRKHGIYRTPIRSVLEKRKCRKCNYENFKVTYSDVVKKAHIRHNNKYIYYKETYIDTNHKMKIKHRDCGKVFDQRVAHHLSGQGCPYCNLSKGETLIMSILCKYNIDYVSQYQIENYMYDIHIVGTDILIEYDGEQHFKPVTRFGGLKRFKKQVKSDLRKNKVAKKNNYTLIRIPYTKYNDLEKHLIISISRYYKYIYDGVLYRDFLALYRFLKIKKNIPVRDLDKYRLIRLIPQ